MCEIILPVSILALLSSSACDSASAYKFYLNQRICDGVVTSCRCRRWR